MGAGAESEAWGTLVVFPGRRILQPTDPGAVGMGEADYTIDLQAQLRAGPLLVPRGAPDTWVTSDEEVMRAMFTNLECLLHAEAVPALGGLLHVPWPPNTAWAAGACGLSCSSQGQMPTKISLCSEVVQALCSYSLGCNDYFTAASLCRP